MAWTLSDALAATFAGEVVSPDVIGVNFSAAAHPLRSPVLGLAWWNNVKTATGHDIPLCDGTATPTTARLTFHSASAYAEFGTPKTLNRATNQLYRAGLVGNDTVSEVQIALSGIPFPVYDVFVFASADTADRSTLSISDGQTTYYYRSAGSTNAGAPRLTRTTSEEMREPTEGAAQYQVFRARSGPECTLTTGGSRHCILSNNVFGLLIVRAGPTETVAMAEKQTPASLKKRSSKAVATPPRSELILAFAPGAVVRVRYRADPSDPRQAGGSLNLHSGPDIALHVNPRIAWGELVLNSHLNGSWGPEERPEGYPLQVPGEVCLSVWAGPNGYFIQAATADALPFCYQYAYRLPEERAIDRITLDLPGVRAVSVQPEL